MEACLQRVSRIGEKGISMTAPINLPHAVLLIARERLLSGETYHAVAADHGVSKGCLRGNLERAGLALTVGKAGRVGRKEVRGEKPSERQIDRTWSHARSCQMLRMPL
jgi:hypothetical protein